MFTEALEFDLSYVTLGQNSYAYYIDSNGNIQQLQKIYADVDSQWVDYEDIPEYLIHAAVAIEDKRFYEHQGVDWIRTIGACLTMFAGSDSSFGGSSITQQVVKNITGDDDVTVQRKVLEIFRAAVLEKKYDKTVIMEYYLNIIYLGEHCTGVKSAAAAYFGKELEDLTAAECAALISITNNPSKYNPYRTTLDSDGLTGMEENDIRRTNTLYEMHNQGYLTDEEYEEALAEELTLKRGLDAEDQNKDCTSCGYHGKLSTFIESEEGYYCPNCGELTDIGSDASESVYSWFMDTVLEDVGEDMATQIYGLDWSSMTSEERHTFISTTIAQGGYHIYTTLDMDVQTAIDNIYQDLSKIPTTQSVQQLQSAIVVIDNATGDIVGMAGGVGDDKGFDDYNRATDALLQTGSAIKPLAVYAPGFESGLLTPASVIDDLPLYYTGSTPFPKNDTRTYSYSRTVLSGIVSSVNAVSVNTVKMLGTTYCFNFAKYKFRLNGMVETYTSSSGTVMTDIDYAPLGLGALTRGVTVRDMAAAYATFANNGTWRNARTYTKVYDSDGNLVLDNTQESDQILSEKTVNYINYCLDNAVNSGTGTAADLSSMGIDVCGKTGTTSSAKDRWFCGYTNYYTAAVWCGYDSPEVITLTGTTTNPASRLWKAVMEQLHTGLSSEVMYDASEMITVSVCLDCGKLATDACYLDPRSASRVTTALVYPEDAPTETCDCHVLVDWCDSCNAVANTYCKQLAELGLNTISQKALVVMTQDEVDAVYQASKSGLGSSYYSDNYIYLINDDGTPGVYYGLSGSLTSNTLPYKVCTTHTAESLAGLVTDDGGGEDEETP